jgi:hypothetical protein
VESLVLVAGLGLIILGSLVWGKAFQSLNNGQRLAHIAGALVLILGGVIFVTGWGMMYETGNRTS